MARTSGAVVVDLTDLDSFPDSDRLSGRFSAIEQCPAGAEVIIRVRDCLPPIYELCRYRIGHVNIHVEGSEPVNVRRWLNALHEHKDPVDYEPPTHEFDTWAAS